MEGGPPTEQKTGQSDVWERKGLNFNSEVNSLGNFIVLFSFCVCNFIDPGINYTPTVQKMFLENFNFWPDLAF